MKKILLILLLAAITTTGLAQVRFETKPTDDVHQMAINAKKMVFIDLYATWCAPCRIMDRDVFSRRDVGEFMNKNFISAKYDVDKSTGAALMKKYKAKGVPFYLILTNDGVLLGSITGSSDASQFMADVRSIIKEQPKQK